MALHAAKSYYNACGFESTPQAVEEMGICLASAHPDDMEIVRRFRAEQATSGNSVVSDSTDADMGATPGMPSTQPSGGVSMVKSIEVDPAIFADEIVFRSKRDQRFADRSSYANVLLMADRASEAERIFHEQFQLAGTQAELNEAVEGIARCMRAEDGNVVRANAWLVTLQQNRTPAAN
jgi:hypothetical protein